MGRVLVQTVRHAPTVLKTGKLTAVDQAMNADLTVRYHGEALKIPVREADAYLAATQDSPSFCGVREMLAEDVYLRAFRLPMTCPCVLDLGANRGLFSLVASKVLHADQVIEVEPTRKYGVVRDLFRQSNDVKAPVKRYWKMVGSQAQERSDDAYISMDTIVRENGLTKIDFAKIDIEGSERDIFQEGDWLSIVQNFAAELHPQWVDVRSVLQAAQESGFEVRPADQFNVPCAVEHAMFLYGSRDGRLLN